MNKLNAVKDGGITGQELTGKTVVIRASSLKPEYADKDRRFVVSGGFGASPYTMGRAVFGKFLLDGEDARMDRGDVEGIAVIPEGKEYDDVEDASQYVEVEGSGVRSVPDAGVDA